MRSEMVNVRQLYWSCAGAAAMGTLLGWAIGAGQATQKIAPTDFIALIGSVGTWVVGIGAFKYARAAHRLREAELSRLAVEEEQRGIAAFNALRSKVLTLVLPDALMEIAGDDISTDSLQGSMRQVLRVARENSMANDLMSGPSKYYTDEMLSDYILLATFAATFRTACSVLEERLDAGHVPCAGWMVTDYKSVRGLAKDLADQAREVAAALDKKRVEGLEQ